MATLWDFLQLWKKHGRPREIIISEDDWIELVMNVNTREIVRDAIGPYLILAGVTVRLPKNEPTTVDLSQERIFHADV